MISSFEPAPRWRRSVASSRPGRAGSTPPGSRTGRSGPRPRWAAGDRGGVASHRRSPGGAGPRGRAGRGGVDHAGRRRSRSAGRDRGRGRVRRGRRPAGVGERPPGGSECADRRPPWCSSAAARAAFRHAARVAEGDGSVGRKGPGCRQAGSCRHGGRVCRVGTLARRRADGAHDRVVHARERRRGSVESRSRRARRPRARPHTPRTRAPPRCTRHSRPARLGRPP